MTGPAVGIDFGTTFSAVACVNAAGKAEILPNSDSDRLTPSVVYFGPDGVLVGKTARQVGLGDPSGMVTLIKRHIYDDTWRHEVDGRAYSAVEVAAHIFSQLRADASAQLGAPVTDAVVTVPYYFTDPHRRAVERAARAGGWSVLKLMNEPTAAAIAYGVERRAQPERVLVFDLGGGTLDVTVCRIAGEEIAFLSSEGDADVGGARFDELLANHLAGRFRQEHGIDINADPVAKTELREKVNSAKHILSKVEETSVRVTAQGRESLLRVTRAEFERHTARLAMQMRVCVADALRAARLGRNDIDRVLLIGGATRMPLIAKMLEQEIRAPMGHAINPDEAVAMGAAIYAARNQVLAGTSSLREGKQKELANLVIGDIMPYSVGVVATRPGQAAPFNYMLVKKGTPLPHEVCKNFYTDADNRTSIRVDVLQGESENIADCQLIGQLLIEGIPSGRKRGTPLEVRLVCNDNGIIEVHAIDLETNRSQFLPIGGL